MSGVDPCGTVKYLQVQQCCVTVIFCTGTCQVMRGTRIALLDSGTVPFLSLIRTVAGKGFIVMGEFQEVLRFISWLV
jgi:hypothetical protein